MNPFSIHSDLRELLCRAAEMGASDVHWSAGRQPACRSGGELIPMDVSVQSESLSEACLALLNEAQKSKLSTCGAVDGAFSVDQGTRWRFNVYRTQGQLACALRRLENQVRDLPALGLPARLYDLCDARAGLFLVAGPTGSGKSTTLAALVDRINRTRRCHIMTIEDPIEYLHRSQTAWVTQRQVGWDAPDFYQALVDALRQDPDVILVGEIRELNTIRTAITAAETGHLVLASVHAADCVGAVERVLSVFPGDEQATIRHLLSMTLRAIVAQHLVLGRATPALEQRGGDTQKSKRVLVSEVLHATPAVSNLISQMNLKQIRSAMETGGSVGMYTMDQCLAGLVRRRLIDDITARGMARNPQLVLEMVQRGERHSIGIS
ncbi:MAG TPA: PilT/PilU family type 4a pilus ATPase [Pirellulaceae bacterium]|nr:PilT/PilU family type 4a pilus ATPase [Pirellulaceae bacterium]